MVVFLLTMQHGCIVSTSILSEGFPEMQQPTMTLVRAHIRDPFFCYTPLNVERRSGGYFDFKPWSILKVEQKNKVNPSNPISTKSCLSK